MIIDILTIKTLKYSPFAVVNKFSLPYFIKNTSRLSNFACYPKHSLIMINNRQEKTEPHEVVFLVEKYPLIGYLIEPYAVPHTPAGHYALKSHRVYLHTYQDYGIEVSEDLYKALQLAEEMDYPALEEKFLKPRQKGRKRGAPKSLEELLRDKEVFPLIREFIDKKSAGILDILRKRHYPLFIRYQSSDWVTKNVIDIAPNNLNAIFNFNRHTDKIDYELTVLSGKKELKLKGKELHILSNSPGWLIIEEILYKTTGNITANNLRPFANHDVIAIPRKMEKEYFRKFILKTVKSQQVHAEGFEIVEEQPIPVPELKIEYNFLKQQYGFILQYAYNEEHFDADDNRMNSITISFDDNEEVSLIKTHRDIKKEQEVKQFLAQVGLKNGDKAWYFPVADESENIYDLFEWLSHNRNELEQNGVRLPAMALDEKSVEMSIPKLELEVNNEDNDWFGVKAIVKIGNYEFPFMRFRPYILSNEREFPLPDGKIFVLPKEWFSRYKELFNIIDEDGQELKISRSRGNLLIDIGLKKEEAVPKITSDEIVIEPPQNLKAKLRNYQHLGVSWMENLRQQKLGGCLADEMGLGKTLQTLAFLLYVKENNLYRDEEDHIPSTSQPQLDLFSQYNLDLKQTEKLKALIVMPLSLVHNWALEAQRFTPTLSIHQHIGLQRTENHNTFHLYDLVLTTYSTLRNDIEMFSKFKFNYMILDESQYIKNPKSKIFRAVRQVQANHRLVLTGTPVENSISDLWSQMTFVNPGILGSYHFFRNEYLLPIEKEQNEEKKNKLKQLVNPFILRRTLKQVAQELPELTEQVFYSEMQPEQKKLYEEEKSKARNLIMEHLRSQGAEKSKILILQSLMKLRQIANHPLMLCNAEETDEIADDATEEPNDNALALSGKFNDVSNQILQIISEDHKVLIFSQFVRHLNLFRYWLDRKEIGYSYLTGAMKQQDRQKMIEQFNDDKEKKVFLISLKAGGTGLNLTAASYVILLDPWWNPAVEKQAISRSHRIGQEKKVMGYRFISSGTVEEKILKLQQRKQQLAEDLLPENKLKMLTEEEIEYLLD